MKKTTVAIILGLIVIFGLFLRFYHLGSQSYWMDEGYTINAVISAIHNGYSGGASILDSGGKYFCPLYCYPTQIIAQLNGQNAVSYRLLAALFGALFTILAFFITKIIFKNDQAALLTAFFVSFSYWQIAWSRQARWYTMLEVFFWLAFLFFYLFLNFCHPERRAKDLILSKNERPVFFRNNKYFYLALSILFTVLAIITSDLAYILPLIMLVWYFFFNKTACPAKLRRGAKLGGVSYLKISIAAFIAIAVIAFAEYGLGLHFIAHALKNVSLHYTLPYYLNFYLRNYWLLIIIAIYGYFSADKNKKRQLTMLALPFMIYLIFLSFFTQIVHYRYLFHTTLFIYMLAAAAIFNEKAACPTKLRHGAKLGGGFIPLLIIILFFLSGEGVIFPKNFYFLESDNPALFNRPYYGYTPQPDFNAAYAAIKKDLKPNDIVISSHPQFTKIFLNQPGYWIKYNYLGMEDAPNTIINNREYYVGAEVIDSLDKLKQVLSEAEGGYIIFDYQSTDGRIDPKIINYIQTNLPLFFYNKINSYSQIWIYKF